MNRYKDGYLENTDILIKNKHLNNAIDKDRVLVSLVSEFEGKVIKVLKRKLTNLVETIKVIEGKKIFIPDNKRINIDITINKGDLQKVVHGSKVYLGLTKLNDKNKYLGKIINILGHVNDPGVDILSVAYEHNIIYEFNKNTLKELESIESSIDLEEKSKRVDLTNEVIFTLDGLSTKDIDDAISLSFKDGLYKLGVHIADVTHYIKKDSSLYKDAFIRGNSYYLADKVIPMLPYQISNGICSLLENEERFAISVYTYIDKEGNIKDYEILKSVIKSKKQMNYENVNKVLKKEVSSEYEEVLFKMLDLSNILKKRLITRGYLNFYSVEAEVVQDEFGKAIDIKKRVSDVAEELIENFMIVTNEVVATHLSNLGNPSIYRVHDQPDIESVEEYLTFAKNLGIDLDIKTVNNYSFQEVLKFIKDRPDREMLSDLLLRSMKKAKYDTNNIGHFGLGSKTYTHFTAPIRRFSDLETHHLLKSHLENKAITPVDRLDKICIQVNERELDSIDAERKVLKMKMAEYMLDKVGNTYEGIISGITKFGFFVKLDNLVEGLVHLNTLKGYYTCDLAEKRIYNRENDEFVLGKRIKIKVINVSKEDHTIDFEVYDGN